MEGGSVRPKREGFAWMVHELHHAHLHRLKYLMIPRFLALKARPLLCLGPEKVPGLRPQPYTPFPAKNICLYAKALLPCIGGGAGYEFGSLDS